MFRCLPSVGLGLLVSLLVAIPALAACSGTDGSGEGTKEMGGDPPGAGGVASGIGGALGTGGTGGDSSAGGGSGGAVPGAGGLIGASGGAGGTVSSGGSGGMGVEPGYLPGFCEGRATAPTGEQWQTDRVYYENDELVYTSDGDQHRIPDFSYAGYHYGERSIPDVPVIETIGPVDGDDTDHIQEALDRVGSRERDENGLRGTVLLEPGTYQVGGQIQIRESGVVLRGSGQGSNPSVDTILQITGTSTRTAIRLGSGSGNPWSEGDSTTVTTPYVPVGAMTFSVADASMFAVDDEVIVRHPSTQAWVNAVDGGGTGSDGDWQSGTKDLVWYRFVRAIDGNEITLDAPLYNQLDGSLTTAVVSKGVDKGYRTEIGLENLRVDIQTAGGEDEAHAHDGVGVVGAQNSWVRDVTVLHFMHAGVYTQGAVRVTVEGCTAIEPVGVRTGGRFYNFDAESNSNLILFTEGEAHDGRHNMIVNGVGSASGIVFHRINSQGKSSQSEGHRHWSHGMLYDTIYGTTGGQVQLVNRGDWGTEHGWASAHSVIWNNTGVSRVQKPPTAQNYAYSSVGSLSTNYPFSGAGPTAIHDIRDSGELFPNSLYEAQLCERLAAK